MKKALTAFALLAVAGAASANSSVQIYGVMDLGIAKGNAGASSNPGGNGANKAWQMKQSSASRLGFRGTEDLGGGLSASFLLEHRFTPDTGSYSATSPFFMQSTVSLSHKSVGTLWMGRDYAPMFWLAVKTDPFGMDGVGQIGANQYADFNSNSDIASRTNNTLGFKSRSFSGLSFDLAYSFKENGGNSQSGGNVQYQNRNIYAGLGYAKVNQAISAAGPNLNSNDELLNAAFIYSFERFRVMAYAAQGKNKNFRTTTNQYTLGMDARIGPGRLKLAASQMDSDVNARDRNKIGIGYDYDLSKSTRLYADYGVAKQKNLSRNNAVAVGMRLAF